MSSIRLPASERPTVSTEIGDYVARPGVWLLATFIVGLVFFVNGHDFATSTLLQEGDFQTADATADNVESGSAKRKIMYVFFGVVGAFLILRPIGQRMTFQDSLFVAMAAFVTFCLASVLWSPAPGLAMRRTAALVLCLVAAVGVVRQLGRQDLVRIAFFVSLAYVLISFAAELALGTFRPWSSVHRFSGTVHPNIQGQLCSLLCLSSLALFRYSGRRQWLYLLAFGFGVALLLCTKSRTSCLCLGAAMFVFWLPTTRFEKAALVGLCAPFVFCGGALIASLAGLDIGERLVNAVTLGRQDQLTSLTGRVPLWNALLPYVADRPLLGHGYKSFWTPEHVREIADRVNWPPQHAHSEYIETALNLGAVGLLLLLICAAGATIRSGGWFLRSKDPGLGLFFAYFTYALIGSFFEAGFTQPINFETFMLCCFAANLACCLPLQLNSTRRLSETPPPLPAGAPA